MLTKRYPTLEISDEQRAMVESLNRDMGTGMVPMEYPDCVLCQSANKELTFANDRYGIAQNTVICTNCGLVYSAPRMNQQSTADFYTSDLYRAIYQPGNYLEKHILKLEWAKKYKHRHFTTDSYSLFSYMDFIIDSGIQYDSVCEIGCAEGANLVPFLKSGKQATGYDYSTSLIAEGRKQGLNLHNGSIEQMEDVYDLCFMKHVLEHTLQPVEDLRRLRSHVGQYLLIEVPGIVTHVPSIQNAHNYYFSPVTLIKLVSQAGYSEIAWKYFPDTNFILALFQKSDKPVIFEFDFKRERKRVKKIIRSFQIRYFLKSFLTTIRNLNPF
jgi:hypothetical protein